MTKEEKKRIRNDQCNSHRQELLAENWGCCVNCFSTKNLEIHHIVPLANGGNHIPSNTVMLCRECHIKAHGKLKRVEDAGKGGRKPTPKPDNADAVIKDYLEGVITRTEAYKRLNYGHASKLTDYWYFQEYLKDHNIVKYFNYIETIFGKKYNGRTYHKYLSARIWYADGTKQDFYRQGEVRSACADLSKRYTKDMTIDEILRIIKKHKCHCVYIPNDNPLKITVGIECKSTNSEIF